MKQDKLNQRLHWTTTITEKVMLGDRWTDCSCPTTRSMGHVGKQKYSTC